MIIGLAWIVPAQAQEEAGDSIARLVMITAKDGHSDELLDAITEYHHWIAQFEGHHEYQWYRVLTGPNTGTFMARTPNHQWADFDAEYDWNKQAGQMFEKNVAPHIENVKKETGKAVDTLAKGTVSNYETVKSYGGYYLGTAPKSTCSPL